MSDTSGDNRKDAGAKGQGAEVSVRIADLPAEATSARAFAALIAAWPEPEPVPEAPPTPGPATSKSRAGALSQEAIRRIADRAEQASAKKR